MWLISKLPKNIFLFYSSRYLNGWFYNTIFIYFRNINKSNEASNEILTNDTNSKRITQTITDKSDKKKIPVVSKSNVEISSHGAIAKETFKKKLTHTIKEKFDTIATLVVKNLNLSFLILLKFYIE